MVTQLKKVPRPMYFRPQRISTTKKSVFAIRFMVPREIPRSSDVRRLSAVMESLPSPDCLKKAMPREITTQPRSMPAMRLALILLFCIIVFSPVKDYGI